ncbi:hypothetical protein MGAST_03795 [Mycobacterium gastri 'Wayne']|nr:hypothetical protein MGAST_03795 [Mycobacterium gastri 'Wayne']
MFRVDQVLDSAILGHHRDPGGRSARIVQLTPNPASAGYEISEFPHETEERYL